MARNNLSGRNPPLCVIIGAGPLLGAALARGFAGVGYALGLIARCSDGLQALADDLTDAGATVTCEFADARDGAVLASALARIEARLGPVDVLIINAFSRHTGLPRDLKSPQAMQAIRDNLLPAISGVQAVLPAMLERQNGVILISGGKSAVDCPVNLAPLGLGKAALRNYAMTLANNVAHHNIRISHVTIWDHIRPGTAFDPDAIATAYVSFAQDSNRHDSEIIFDGAMA